MKRNRTTKTIPKEEKPSGTLRTNNKGTGTQQYKRGKPFGYAKEK